VFVTNHVLFGVTLGQRLQRRPGLAFLAGLGSHLVLDALPHWGCGRNDPAGDEAFLRAARRDGILGLAVLVTSVVLVDKRSRISTMAAIGGSVLLDLDKPFDYFFGRNPFPRRVQTFHGQIQNESRDGMPNEVGFGLGLATVELASGVATRRHHTAQK
jgi:hypothetical protein